MPATLTVDSSNAAASLLCYLGEVPSHAREQGRRHERASRIMKLARRNGETVTANVSMSHRMYPVELKRTPDGWRGRCPCGHDSGGCEHAAAVAYAWLNHIQVSRSSGPDMARENSAAGRAGGIPVSKGAATLPPTPQKLTFRQQTEPILAAKLGRRLSSEEGAFLGTLSNIFHNLRQSHQLSRYDIERLGFTTRQTRVTYYNVYGSWWDTPPTDPLALWQYIAHDIETSGLEIPEFMRPLTDTAPVRNRLQSRMRRESIKSWNERFASLAQTNSARGARTAPDEQPEWLDLRLRVTAEAWILETRTQPDGVWKSAPRAFIERFAHQRRGGLGGIDASPAVFAFLAVCQDHSADYHGVSLAPQSYGGPELLRRLISHPLARTLVVDAADGPLTLAAVSLRWAISRDDADSRDYRIALSFPDGKTLAFAPTHLPGDPDLYLHGSMVYRGPPKIGPSVGGSAAASEELAVPAEVIDRPDVVQVLRDLGAMLPDELEQRIVSVPMRPRFECTLDIDVGGNEIFTLKLFAASKEPRVQRVWQEFGWNAPPSLPHDKTSTAEGKLHVFDMAAANDAAGRLAGLKVGYDPFKKHWTRRVSKTFPDDFASWRESLPRGIEVLATGELASLLDAPVKARVDLDLIETNAHRDWFDLALALKPEDTTLTPEEIALLLKARGKLVRLPGKGWRRLNVQIEGAPAAALEAAGFDADTIADAALAGERHRFHALQLAQSAVADLLPERQAEALRARAREIALPTPPEVPAGLRAELRPYQREGFEFLAFLSANQLGGVLADDMGLGKTMQTLAWLLWLAERQPADKPLRALVVCPKSVVGNWEAETAKFAPALAVVRFTPALAKAKGGTPGASEAGAERPTILVANYSQLRLAADFFSTQLWHAVILDEGQFIKTPTSKVAQVARELPGECRLILTGTPIENRLLDLWSLFAFSLPGLLGTQAAFKRQYADDNPLALTRLRSRVRHFLLRRTKTQVAADLPARTEEDVLVDLEGEQARLYQAELKRARAELLKVQTVRELDQARFSILASLMRLRQICCHPALIDSAHSEAPSAKLDELMERVEELRAEGHQVLVFSQFVTMLELIRERLVASGIEHLMLTGQTENRETLVRQFQTERTKTVFLLSLKAAGFGLNLTAASYVILYDPWWNPAVEAQAIDRTHRIGQSVPVNAYRFIARGTVEEKIRVLQREKAALAGAIVQEESLASVLDLDSLRQILG